MEGVGSNCATLRLAGYKAPSVRGSRKWDFVNGYISSRTGVIRRLTVYDIVFSLMDKTVKVKSQEQTHYRYRQCLTTLAIEFATLQYLVRYELSVLEVHV